MNEKLPENLVALVYANNSCYADVTSNQIPGLEIDLAKKQWAWKHPQATSTHKPTPREIGQSNYAMRDCSSGVIGVYDRTKDNHLKSMIQEWKEIQDSKAGRFGD